MLLLGTACIRIGFDGSYLYYVKPILRWPLVASGVLVAALGVLGLLGALRKPAGQDHAAHGHAEHADHTAQADGCAEGDHNHVPRVAWLLTLPVFAILLIAPGPLGAYAAARDSGTVAQPAGDSDFPPLPATDPAPLPLFEYAVRAVWDEGRSLFERDVDLLGFVSKRPEGGWYLTRIQLACCAADGIATKVEVSGDVPQLPEDTWVRVVGRWQPSTNPDPSEAIPAMRAVSVTQVAAPADPYE
jgi:uncharacterized repeat protein (TIGR03943 family)